MEGKLSAKPKLSRAITESDLSGFLSAVDSNVSFSPPSDGPSFECNGGRRKREESHGLDTTLDLLALLRGGSVLSKETHLRNYTVGDGVLAPLCVYAPTNTRTLNSQCSELPTYSRSAEEPSEVEVEVKLRAMLHRISEIVTIFLLVPVGSQVSRNEAKNLTFQKLSWHQLQVYYYCTYLPLRYTVKLYNCPVILKMPNPSPEQPPMH